jgi:hypothetical protein
MHKLRPSAAIDGRDAGASTIGTALGAAVFLAFMLLATHTLLGLYAGSVVSAAAWDGAHHAATHAEDADVDVTTQDVVKQRLGGMQDVSIQLTRTGDDMSVAVGVKRPSFVPAGLKTTGNTMRISRTVHVRAETVR